MSNTGKNYKQICEVRVSIFQNSGWFDIELPIINGWQPWTTVTQSSILVVSVVPESPPYLHSLRGVFQAYVEQFHYSYLWLNVFLVIFQEFNKDPIYGKFLRDCLRNLQILIFFYITNHSKVFYTKDTLKTLRKKQQPFVNDKV